MRFVLLADDENEFGEVAYVGDRVDNGRSRVRPGATSN
jgi:hypothetical protein